MMPMPTATAYGSLGVVPVLNAAAAVSRLGGATLSPAVRAAMDAAAVSFVDVEELHDAVGRRLAELTRTEAACVTCGSAAGILVAVAALLVGSDRTAAARLPVTSSAERRGVAVWRGHVSGRLAGTTSHHENGYLSAVRMAGAEVRVVDDAAAVRPDDLGVLWFPRMFPSLDEDAVFDAFVVAARPAGVPVVVDAADQIPPRANLWRFGAAGADLTIFSGGKGLGGPTSSGLVVGRADLVAACRANSGPEHSVGRPAKVGREQLVGLLAAVEEAMTVDEAAEHAGWVAVVEAWTERLAGPGGAGWTVRRVATSHSGQPVPRLVVEPISGDGTCRDDVIGRLWAASPRVAVLPEGVGVALNPQLLRGDEPAQVADAVVSVVAEHLRGCARCQGRGWRDTP